MADGEKEDKKIVINAERFLRRRRPDYSAPEEIIAEALLFFRQCEKRDSRPTVTGLALWLGYSGRAALCRAAEAGEGRLGDAIRRAKSVVAMWREGQLGSGKDAGHMFVLKNMGWKDEQRREISGGVRLDHSGLSPREAAEALIAGAGNDGALEGE